MCKVTTKLFRTQQAAWYYAEALRREGRTAEVREAVNGQYAVQSWERCTS